MRNKPAKLYLLIGAENKPYLHKGQARAFNSKGAAIKKAKQIYQRTSLLFSVVRAGLVLKVAE